MKLTSWGLIFFLLCLTQFSNAAEYYNKYAGFGYWYPGSWTSVENGRSATITGSEFDRDKSEIFIGDIWDFSVVNLESLKIFLENKYGRDSQINEINFSTLSGFFVGNSVMGEYYLYREMNNYVYIRFSLKGEGYQLEQAKYVLNSIYIRNDPSENVK